MTLVALCLVVWVLYRATTADERSQCLNAAIGRFRQLGRGVHGRRQQPRDSFREALRVRTPHTVVTQALIGLNVAIWLTMLVSGGASNQSDVLVSWGGSIGPRTTHGEAWRLATTMFVHASVMHLAVNMAALLQLGLILERLVGRFAFAAVYMTSGVFASLASLIAYPMSVGVGASGAIYGIYGLLVASSVWTIVKPSAVTISLATVKRLAPVAVAFVVYNIVADSLRSDAEVVGLLTGLTSSLVLTVGVSARMPTPRRVGLATALTAVIVTTAAISLRVVNDIRPEIAQIVAIEERTAKVYDAAVVRFTTGRIGVERLIDTINRAVTPELHAATARIRTLDGVAPEQEPLVEHAAAYLRLRDRSWKLRAQGLAKGNMRTLQEADKVERESLKVLEKIRNAA